MSVVNCEQVFSVKILVSYCQFDGELGIFCKEVFSAFTIS